MKLYTLRRKKDGALPEVGFSFNDGIDVPKAAEVSIWFTNPRLLDSLWTSFSVEGAERAKTSTSWYNASWETPNHSEKAEDLEVVDVAELLDK